MKKFYAIILILSASATFAQMPPDAENPPPEPPEENAPTEENHQAQNATVVGGISTPLQASPATTEAKILSGQSSNQNAQQQNSAPSAVKSVSDATDDVQRSLLTRNPFGNSPSSKSSKNAQEQNSLELTSICLIDGKWNFVVVDTINKISYALVLKGKISQEVPLRVDFFDEETMSISLSNSVTEYVLTLKKPDEPAQAAVATPAQEAKKQQNAQQNNRRNFWMPLQNVEVPTAKRINRR